MTLCAQDIQLHYHHTRHLPAVFAHHHPPPCSGQATPYGALPLAPSHTFPLSPSHYRKLVNAIKPTLLHHVTLSPFFSLLYAVTPLYKTSLRWPPSAGCAAMLPHLSYYLIHFSLLLLQTDCVRFLTKHTPRTILHLSPFYHYRQLVFATTKCWPSSSLWSSMSHTMSHLPLSYCLIHFLLLLLEVKSNSLWGSISCTFSHIPRLLIEAYSQCTSHTSHKYTHWNLTFLPDQFGRIKR